jgi:GT2 family glycosyltransferase
MNAAELTDNTAPICVVIPVFNAPEELDRCLASVAATTTEVTEVLIIDDASTDPATAAVIGRWQAQAPAGWMFKANRVNRGFVATANAGMRACANNVVLLNSDTEVTPGWLQGLQRCLASDPSIATATPWTNNGEIVSLPKFCQVNPVPKDASWVAEVIARAGTVRYPELPTAVGFCMAVSRHAINRVGLFDEALFGKGYGEENDFSRRAVVEGLRNVLCDDVYVVHLGGRSFGPTGLGPDQSSMERLLSRHPDYLECVQSFIVADPLMSRREEILQALNQAGVPMG